LLQSSLQAARPDSEHLYVIDAAWISGAGVAGKPDFTLDRRHLSHEALR
jgi:hypothetical protein